LLYFLKNHTLCQYKQLIEIACSDNPGKQRRFSIAYVLLSTHYSANIIVVIQTNEVLPVPSVTSIFSSAG
jgi:NADH dehydrogenase (ubiquinone) Fe-S protein 3